MAFDRTSVSLTKYQLHNLSPPPTLSQPSVVFTSSSISNSSMTATHTNPHSMDNSITNTTMVTQTIQTTPVIFLHHLCQHAQDLLIVKYHRLV